MFSMQSGVLRKDLETPDSRSLPRPEPRTNRHKAMEARVLEVLEEAVQRRAWLTSDELAVLVNRHPIAIALWRHGHRPRPGYRLTRRQEGRQVWWRVNRER